VPATIAALRPAAEPHANQSQGARLALSLLLLPVGCASLPAQATADQELRAAQQQAADTCLHAIASGTVGEGDPAGLLRWGVVAGAGPLLLAGCAQAMATVSEPAAVRCRALLAILLLLPLQRWPELTDDLQQRLASVMLAAADDAGTDAALRGRVVAGLAWLDGRPERLAWRKRAERLLRQCRSGGDGTAEVRAMVPGLLRYVADLGADGAALAPLLLEFAEPGAQAPAITAAALAAAVDLSWSTDAGFAALVMARLGRDLDGAGNATIAECAQAMAVVHARHPQVLADPAAAAAFAALLDRLDADDLQASRGPGVVALRLVARSADLLARLPPGELQRRLHGRLDALLTAERAGQTAELRLAVHRWREVR